MNSIKPKRPSVVSIFYYSHICELQYGIVEFYFTEVDILYNFGGDLTAQ
jgi:hypothetical protein